MLLKMKFLFEGILCTFSILSVSEGWSEYRFVNVISDGSSSKSSRHVSILSYEIVVHSSSALTFHIVQKHHKNAHTFQQKASVSIMLLHYFLLRLRNSLLSLPKRTYLSNNTTSYSICIKLHLARKRIVRTIYELIHPTQHILDKHEDMIQ